MIWRVEQRGIGECMIVTSDGKSTCMGFATFVGQRAKMAEWLDPLERDLRQMNEGGRARLTNLQHLLLGSSARSSTRAGRAIVQA